MSHVIRFLIIVCESQNKLIVYSCCIYQVLFSVTLNVLEIPPISVSNITLFKLSSTFYCCHSFFVLSFSHKMAAAVPLLPSLDPSHQSFRFAILAFASRIALFLSSIMSLTRKIKLEIVSTGPVFLAESIRILTKT